MRYNNGYNYIKYQNERIERRKDAHTLALIIFSIVIVLVVVLPLLGKAMDRAINAVETQQYEQYLEQAESLHFTKDYYHNP